MSSTNKPGRPKSEAKREAILTAASDLFLTQGYGHTSMDGVARQSGVSKQTVYSHYKNKDALFTAVISAKCEQYRLFPEAQSDKSQSLTELITYMAHQCIELFHDNAVIAMYSTIIAEAKNTPHVAELFYQAGPMASIQSLAQQLIHCTDTTLTDEKATHLALDFYNLLKTDFHMRSLMGLPFALTSAEKQTLIDDVVHKLVCLHNYHY